MPETPRPGRPIPTTRRAALAGLAAGFGLAAGGRGRAAAQPQADRPWAPALPDRPPFSEQDQARAGIPGIPNARGFADDLPRIDAAAGPWLCVSVGGADGAYGAGVLVGWSEAGTRPGFAVVTGVSTGAMIAPSAFVGSARDAALAEYAALTAADVFEGGGKLPESLFDTWPLRELIARHMTAELLELIAAEHRTGRRLYIVTTNLDAGRAVAWDIGAIADHGGVAALALVRNVLLASASVPGLFPPVMIDVVVDGRVVPEMHGDGGITMPFFVPPHDAGQGPVHLVMNGRLAPDFETTPRGTAPVLGRAVGVALRHSARVHLAALEAGAHGEVLVARIPDAFQHRSRGPFDTHYMQALFRRGHADGRAGIAFRRIKEGATCEMPLHSEARHIDVMSGPR